MRDIGLIVKKSIDLKHFETKLRATNWRVTRRNADRELQVFDANGDNLVLCELDHALAAEDYELLGTNPLPPEQARYYLMSFSKKVLLHQALRLIADDPGVWIDCDDGETIRWGPDYVKTLAADATTSPEEIA